MRRTTLLIASVLLAVPAAAQAKAGVVFDQYPETARLGTPFGFTVMAYRYPPSSGGEGHPLEGIHPLVTFRSESGRVMRVRASRTDLNGIGYGKVAFTDKGPWTSEMNAGSPHGGDAERSEPFEVGIGLTQTMASADETAAAEARRDAGASSGGFPWVWLLSGASILAALTVAALRQRGHWRTT